MSQKVKVHRNGATKLPKRATRKPHPVLTIKPPAQLWITAMIRAHADPQRLLWLDSETVIVANSPTHRNYLRKRYAR